MIIKAVVNYIRGYVTITIEGFFIEKFLNICAKRKFKIWDTERDKQKASLNIGIKAFKNLRQIAKKTICRVKIKRRVGMPFLLKKYNTRKFFFTSTVVCFAVFYILSLFIWRVEVLGNEKVDKGEIFKNLKELGVEKGILKYKVDAKNVANSLMLRTNIFSWINIIIKGNVLRVYVCERTFSIPIIPKDEPCDIVAVKDGLITSLLVKSGDEKVKVGDTVREGQILITGEIVSAKEGVPKRFVHSNGSVKARTWYMREIIVNTKQNQALRTGESIKKYFLVLFDKRVCLLNKNIKFLNYDKEEFKKRVSIGKDLVFPFEFHIDRFNEINIIEKELSLDEAKKNALERLNIEITECMPKNIKELKRDIYFKYNFKGELVSGTIVECEEEIGEVQRF